MTRPVRAWQVYLHRGQPSVNGIFTLTARLSGAIDEAGSESRVILLRSDSSPQAVSRAATDVTAVGPDLRAVDRWWGRQLAGPERPDVVHFHEAMRPAHVLLARRCRAAGIPYLVSPHSGFAPPNLERAAWKKRLFTLAINRRYLRSAGAVVACTPAEVSEVRAYLGGRAPRIAVVPNALDAEVLSAPRWTGPPGPTDRRPVIVTFCRYDVRQKGLDQLAEMARHLPDAEVIVYGEPDGNEPDRLAALRVAAPTNFRLAPAVFGEEKWRILAEADLFIQPSRWEGLSAALLEAMAVGAPCAVSEPVARTVPLRELDLGLVLDPDPVQAAKQIEVALQEPVTRGEWGRRAADHARAVYAPAVVGAAHLELYRELIGDAERSLASDERAT